MKKEINESLLFKFNDSILQNIEKLKAENKDLATVFDWLEEFSTMKVNKLEIKETKTVGSPLKDSFISHLKGKNSKDFEILEEFKIIPCESKYFTISDSLISNIEDISFNIFSLEKEVGAKNILSTISCYVFTTMGFYSFIDYNKFENFVQEITKGYDRKNPYHNVNK